MLKIFFIGMLIGLNVYSQELSIVGKWKTIDDETKEAKSIVEIYTENEVYKAKVIQLFQKPTDDQNPKCDKCNDSRKGQLVLGMQIMDGLKKKSTTEWGGGDILDPKNGKIYSCKAELIEEGKKLKMRGYLGISLFGRTQIWERQ